MMWEAAARKIKERGGQILMGTRLEQPALRRGRTGVWTIGASTARRRRRDVHGRAT